MKYSRKNLVSQQFGNVLVLLDHETSRIISLNPTATFIWNLLKKPKTFLEIYQKIIQTYPGAPKQDVRECLTNLVKEKMVKTVK